MGQGNLRLQSGDVVLNHLRIFDIVIWFIDGVGTFSAGFDVIQCFTVHPENTSLSSSLNSHISHGKPVIHGERIYCFTGEFHG